MSVFSERLKELRIKRGLNQADIAEVIGASVQSYSAYESGREPKYDMLCQLCDYFEVTADYLLGRTDAEMPEHATLSDVTGLSLNAIANLEVFKNKPEYELKYKSLNFLINVGWSTKFFENLFYFLFANFRYEGGGDEEVLKVSYKEDPFNKGLEIPNLDLSYLYFGKIQVDLFDLKVQSDNMNNRWSRHGVRGWE